MSATPRPWKAGNPAIAGEAASIIGPGGGQIGLGLTGANRDLIVRAVNAFDALLAVAKIADFKKHRLQCIACTSVGDQPHVAGCVFDKLSIAHPDWRTW